ncbi:mCG1030589, partial [Mus musculus]
ECHWPSKMLSERGYPQGFPAQAIAAPAATLLDCRVQGASAGVMSTQVCRQMGTLSTTGNKQQSPSEWRTGLPAPIQRNILAERTKEYCSIMEEGKGNLFVC